MTREMLAGDGNARIGTPGDKGYVPASEESMAQLLQRFNAFEDKGKDKLVEQKVAILNDWLEARDFAPIPIYNDDAKRQAKDNRDRILQDFEPGDLPGVLLPGPVTGTPPGPDR